MPIYKYKSLEEAEKHLDKLLPADPLQRLLHLEKMITALRPPKKLPRGIFKFKTLEEANKHREETTSY